MLEEKRPASKLGITVISSEKLNKKEAAYQAPTYQEIINKADESVQAWYQFLTAAATNEQKIQVMVMLIRELMAKYHLKS